MDTDACSVPAPIFFALTTHLSRDGRQAIVLHLYRGVAPVITRTIATVELGIAESIISKCRQHLEARGVELMGHRIHREPRSADFEFRKAS